MCYLYRLDEKNKVKRRLPLLMLALGLLFFHPARGETDFHSILKDAFPVSQGYCELGSSVFYCQMYRDGEGNKYYLLFDLNGPGILKKELPDGTQLNVWTRSTGI